MAGLEGDHASAHGIDHLAVMGRHDDGGSRTVDAVEQPHDAERDGRVEVARRLVAHQKRRAVDHGAGDGDALLLAAGELVGVVVHLLGKADEAQRLGHLHLDDRARLADALERERDVLVHRLVRQEFEVLVDRANLAAEVRDLPVAQLREVLARDDDLAARGAQLAREELEQGRLAGAGVTDDEHELAGIDVEAHAVERGLVGLGRVDECCVSKRDGRPARVGYHAVAVILQGCEDAFGLWLRLDVARGLGHHEAFALRCPRRVLWGVRRNRGDRLQGLGVRRRLGRRVRRRLSDRRRVRRRAADVFCLLPRDGVYMGLRVERPVALDRIGLRDLRTRGVKPVVPLPLAAAKVVGH